MITAYFSRVWPSWTRMLILAVFSGPFVVACAPPTKPTSLQKAEAVVAKVQSDPTVRQYAPVKLNEAQEALQQAQTAWEESKMGKEKIAHRAYLATQRARIAEVAAAGKKAQVQITDLSEKRERLVLKAAEARAEQAKEQVEAAQSQVRQMQQRLADLEAKKTNRGYVLTLGNILFALDKAELTLEAKQSLSHLVQFLKDFPEREVVIEGYTDSTGSKAYNLDLSRQRARAVRRYLVHSGIAPGRIVAHGYGESYPIASNNTAAGRARNRRVDIVILQEGETAEEYQHPS